MNSPCVIRVNCPDGEVDSPVRNFSAEAPEIPGFISPSIPYGIDRVPLGSSWTAQYCFKTYQSYVSMEDAERGARLLALDCVAELIELPNDTPGKPNKPWFTYTNKEQTCVVECEGGGEFSWTVAAGEYSGSSQAMANSIAKSFACKSAEKHRICMSDIDDSISVPMLCRDVEVGIRLEATGYYVSEAAEWTLVSGAFPDGMTMTDATGRHANITGTPTTFGLFTFKLRVQVSYLNLDHTFSPTNVDYQEREYVVEVGGISTETLPDPILDAPYSETLATTGMLPPIAWTVTDGSLPDGLELNSLTGEIYGSATEEKGYAFTITATDEDGDSCSKEFFVDVSDAKITTESPLPNGEEDSAYSVTFEEEGLTAPVSWAVISGSIPSGLGLNVATGELSGTPTLAGDYTFTIQASDLT